MSKKPQKLIVVLGPTASGKSDLAVALAKQFDGEVISADSRQVYKGLNIGTGKITKKEMRGVRHHLLDVANPRKQFSVAEYQALGQNALANILTKHKLPIICGGTGFYIDSLLYEYALPAVKPDAKLRAKLEKLSTPLLFGRLRKLDPRRARNIDPHNRRRLIRALEIVLVSGKRAPTPGEAQAKTSPYQILKIGIKWPNEVLRARIQKRLKARMRAGMLREISRLHTQGVSYKRMDELGLEYRFLSRYAQGLLTKEEVTQKLETEIWHYAKRQMTWFKRDNTIHWVTTEKEASRLVRSFLKK